MFTGAKIPSSSPSHIVNSQDESSISRKRKLVDKSSCSKVKRPNLNSSDDEFSDNTSFYSNGNSKLVVHKSCNIVSSKSSKVVDKAFAFNKVVEKKNQETSIKSFDFVLNKSIEVKTTDAKNNSFDFVLDRNYILKDKINKSLDVNISGSSSEYLVNRRFEGVLKGCSSERKGFEESTAMDSGSTNDNGITAMDNGMEEVDWIKDLGKGIAEDDEEFYSGDDFVQTKFEDSRLSNIKVSI